MSLEPQEDTEEEEITVHPAILELLDQRLAEYEKNPQAVSTWEEVQARAFRRRQERGAAN
ncbi:MAG TPA: addiction module protein [Prosthecobacter sp.]